MVKKLINRFQKNTCDVVKKLLLQISRKFARFRQRTACPHPWRETYKLRNQLSFWPYIYLFTICTVVFYVQDDASILCTKCYCIILKIMPNVNAKSYKLNAINLYALHPWSDYVFWTPMLVNTDHVWCTL